MKPRLLVIENGPGTLDQLIEITAKPRKEWCVPMGVEGFDAEPASTAEAARSKLRESEKRARGFDAVLLDLRLPRNKEDLRRGWEDDEVGRDLLAEIARNADIAVVILTGYPSTENLVWCLQRGATDFLIKPIMGDESRKMVFLRLVKAVGAVREQAYRRLKGERALRLRIAALEWERAELAKGVAEAAHRISTQLELIETSFFRQRGRGSVPDATTPMAECIKSAQVAANDIVTRIWQAPGRSEGSTLLKSLDLKTVINEEVARAMPCFLHSKVDLKLSTDGALKTQTVEDDLRKMLAEMLLSALDAAVSGGSVQVRARRDPRRKNIEVTASYLGSAASEQVRETLAGGSMPLERLDAASESYCFLWSLARNIGIRLDTGQHGQRVFVKFLIPVINE